MTDSPRVLHRDRNRVCSFCGKRADEVQRLIVSGRSGPNEACICDGCVRICSDLVAEEAPGAASAQGDGGA
jgi:ATP-dependent Clp protease ATP-binding subunit ClpX